VRLEAMTCDPKHMVTLHRRDRTRSERFTGQAYLREAFSPYSL
jgi:hypothetical protein